MQLTGIKWLDIAIVIVLSLGLLSGGLTFLLSRAGVQKALAKHEWLRVLEPILGAAINKAEAWGREHSKKGGDKLEHATDVVMKGMDALGVPKAMKNEELIKSMIESKLTGGSMSDVASGVLSKITNGK